MRETRKWRGGNGKDGSTIFGMDDINTKKSDRRPAPISFRPPEKLRDEFYARAKNSGLSLNAFITQCIFDRGTTNSVIDRKPLALLLSQAARLNGHLEEMGQSSTDSQNLLILEECRHELSEIRAALLIAIGRNA